MSFFRELKRRNVFRVLAAYVVTAWLLIEVSSTLEQTLRLPDWADTLLAFFLILGFPLALFFSWAYEITPEGIRREKDLSDDYSSRGVTGRKLDRLIIALMSVGLAYFAIDKFFLDDAADQLPAANQMAEQASPQAAAGVPDLSIAVLPFVNMSSDPEQEFFSDGLTEELLNLLAGINELKVAARTSSFFYKDKLETVPLPEIARQLEVAHVLEGSVRKSGSKIRITAQLISAHDGFHLWSETWDRELTDVFEIQDEIAAAVAAELQIKLLGDTPHATIIDTESYELALQGRFLFNRRNEGDLQRAMEVFEKAIEIDPNNAIAWIGVSPLYAYLFEPPDVERFLNAAQRAVELDPSSPEARIRYAQALLTSGRREEGTAEYEIAKELGKDNPLVLSIRAGALCRQGSFDLCLELQRRAVNLDPLHKVNRNNLANYALLAGRFEEAVSQSLQLLEVFPDNYGSMSTLAQARLHQGRPEEAMEWLERGSFKDRIASVDGAEMEILLRAVIQFSLGNQEAADTALQQFIETYGESHKSRLAAIYAWRGDNEQAFYYLNRELAEHENRPEMAVHDPLFGSLHTDPRWPAVAEAWNE